MDRGVKKVRKAIEKRKKLRGSISKGSDMKKIYPAFPQDEEKHGFYPFFSEEVSPSEKKGTLVTGFILKGMLSVMLFLGVALLQNTDSEALDAPKQWTSGALTKEFPFAQVNEWYRDTFGNPLAFSPELPPQTQAAETMALPVSGNITESFHVNGKGIKIAPEETTEVSALRDGIVIFAGKDKETEKTVIVQHADGTTSSYGYLSDIDVHLYQFVVNNQPLGTFQPSSDNEMVYFSIEKDNKFIDPVQVIQVDEKP
ncbi:M23 family metallopeptidase [Oceanobacillus caeni]|uniref:Stage IV sporulation protein FA n=1 Tax=Oceanobacillus caeni TaxID=405946 RepID=A0ABR5MLT3_9BACI|nr:MULTISPECIES: M23 family metallopeptidase [Bacillaceae]KKE80524.1 stage IV sporulation protein FA [Bacilli bacterium VT-13-104]PZD87756.1 M23 family peptidase [Bacilli bacterium]KPH77109.1 stage IV sporulation protein FA [Oceanobacillus caeni]MBU8789547.1 M23 family metallopeptidase [Oceanobacillus caeni]MCR1833958.1 M23 family metallopeptidase [Oceanobacillus caeni]